MSTFPSDRGWKGKQGGLGQRSSQWRAIDALKLLWAPKEYQSNNGICGLQAIVKIVCLKVHMAKTTFLGVKKVLFEIYDVLHKVPIPPRQRSWQDQKNRCPLPRNFEAPLNPPPRKTSESRPPRKISFSRTLGFWDIETDLIPPDYLIQSELILY